MKKILLSVLVALLISTTASAQKFLSFGVKAGINVSTVAGLRDVIKGTRPDFTGGVFAELRPIKFLGLSIEALYSGQGFKTSQIQFNDWTASLNASLGYIDVPIMAKIYLTRGFSINVGYQPSFLVGATGSLGHNNENQIHFNKVVSSLPVGLSYSFAWGLLVDVRYNIGLSDLNQPIDYDADYSDDLVIKSLNIRNQVFTISAGWRF